MLFKQLQSQPFGPISGAFCQQGENNIGHQLLCSTLSIHFACEVDTFLIPKINVHLKVEFLFHISCLCRNLGRNNICTLKIQFPRHHCSSENNSPSGRRGTGLGKNLTAVVTQPFIYEMGEVQYSEVIAFIMARRVGDCGNHVVPARSG